LKFTDSYENEYKLELLTVWYFTFSLQHIASAQVSINWLLA